MKVILEIDEKTAARLSQGPHHTAQDLEILGHALADAWEKRDEDDEDDMRKKGEAIVKEFRIKKMAGKDMYQGENGTKTALGLARTIQAILLGQWKF